MNRKQLRAIIEQRDARIEELTERCAELGKELLRQQAAVERFFDDLAHDRFSITRDLREERDEALNAVALLMAIIEKERGGEQ